MFIGFEDIDLSIRLYQSGMKVGTCGAISLIHDHPKPSSNKDKDYEKIRFTRSILKESADYLENKWEWFSGQLQLMICWKRSNVVLN